MKQLCCKDSCRPEGHQSAGNGIQVLRAREAADSAGEAARVMRLLSPTGWLPPPLLAAAELLPALPRADAAEVRAPG